MFSTLVNQYNLSATREVNHVMEDSTNPSITHGSSNLVPRENKPLENTHRVRTQSAFAWQRKSYRKSFPGSSPSYDSGFLPSPTSSGSVPPGFSAVRPGFSQASSSTSMSSASTMSSTSIMSPTSTMSSAPTMSSDYNSPPWRTSSGRSSPMSVTSSVTATFASVPPGFCPSALAPSTPDSSCPSTPRSTSSARSAPMSLTSFGSWSTESVAYAQNYTYEYQMYTPQLPAEEVVLPPCVALPPSCVPIQYGYPVSLPFSLTQPTKYCCEAVSCEAECCMNFETQLHKRNDVSMTCSNCQHPATEEQRKCTNCDCDMSVIRQYRRAFVKICKGCNLKGACCKWCLIKDQHPEEYKKLLAVGMDLEERAHVFHLPGNKDNGHKKPTREQEEVLRQIQEKIGACIKCSRTVQGVNSK